jgi:hypothetical protein
MKKKFLFPLSVLASLLLLTAFPYSRVALTQRPDRGPAFVAKGSVLVSGPTDSAERVKTATGFKFAASRKAQPRIDQIEFDATLRGQRLDPNSPGIRKAIEQAIQSTGWVVEDNSTQVERQWRAKKGAAQSQATLPKVTLVSRSTVSQPSISFGFSGRGAMPLRPLNKDNRDRKVAAGDEGEGEGLITNFRSTVPELRALNGMSIRVKGKFHVDQVDASGVARGRVEFELRSLK